MSDSRQRRWYLRNKERMDAYFKEWCKRNPHKRREYGKRRRAALKQAVIAVYGPTCRCCGEANETFLAVDHINGGGSKDPKGGGKLYAWLKRNNYPPGFQILCFNCNFAKWLVGDCPHKLES